MYKFFLLSLIYPERLYQKSYVRRNKAMLDEFDERPPDTTPPEKAGLLRSSLLFSIVRIISSIIPIILFRFVCNFQHHLANLQNCFRPIIFKPSYIRTVFLNYIFLVFTIFFYKNAMSSSVLSSNFILINYTSMKLDFFLYRAFIIIKLLKQLSLLKHLALSVYSFYVF